MRDLYKIEKFLEKEFKSKITDVCIVENSSGNFELFNEYFVGKKLDGIYTVKSNVYTGHYDFTSLRNAFSWCIFHKQKRFNITKRIEELDLLLNSVDIVMIQQRKLLKNAKSLENKLIFTAKLHENKVKKHTMQKELLKYINISKKWQIKKFLNKLPK